MTEKPEDSISVNKNESPDVPSDKIDLKKKHENINPNEDEDSDFVCNGENEAEEEEDSIAPEEDIEDDGEIDGLVEDSEMPIEQLLAKYGMAPEPTGDNAKSNKRTLSDESSSDKRMRRTLESNPDNVYEKTNMTSSEKEKNKFTTESGDSTDSDASNNAEDEEENRNKNWCKTLISESSPLYNSDDDEDYVPTEVEKTWKAEVRIGSEYQIEVPAFDDKENQPDLELEQRVFKETSLLWDPENLSETQVIEYEREYAEKMNTPLPTERTVDYEEALFLLTQCNYDPKEAMNRLSLKQFDASIHFGNYMSTWTEQDCQSFERGFALFNKDFRQIHLLKLKHRSINEIILFYYMWKKTARYDEFSKIHRRNKKKPVHPGLTDFMDCLTHEQEMIAESLMNGNGTPSIINVGEKKSLSISDRDNDPTSLSHHHQQQHSPLNPSEHEKIDSKKSLSATQSSNPPIIDVPEHSSSATPLII